MFFVSTTVGLCCQLKSFFTEALRQTIAHNYMSSVCRSVHIKRCVNYAGFDRSQKFQITKHYQDELYNYDAFN